MAWTTPRTYLVDEALTAAILNLDVRDNLAYLKGDAWITPGLSNAWAPESAADYGPPRYRRIGDEVAMTGTMEGGNFNVAAFTLVAGLRPLKIQDFLVVGGGAMGPTRVQIVPAGTVVPLSGGGTNGSINFAGIRFPLS